MKYLESRSTGELGVLEVNKLVRLHNSIFQPISHENDIGIDALIQFIEDEIPTNKMIAVQIKTGNSYFYKNGDSKIPIDGHYLYWSEYPLPVFGITCKLSRSTGDCELYWIDISQYLRDHKNEIENGELNVIRYPSNELSRLNVDTFSSMFVPYVFNKIPRISLAKAKELLFSNDFDGARIGMRVLFYGYGHKRRVWDWLFEFFKISEPEKIPRVLIYFVSHIPGHPDLWYRDNIPQTTRDYAKSQIANFTRNDIQRLLFFIDDENWIARGTLGQCVEATVSIIKEFLPHLEAIIADQNQPNNIRSAAASIYAYHKQRDSICFLQNYADLDMIALIISHIDEYGFIDFY